jgi:lysophosphatidate acyltransferase
MAWWIIKPIVAVSAIAVSTLGLLSTKYQKARFYLNLGLYSGTLGIWSIWGVVVSILATAVGQVSFRLLFLSDIANNLAFRYQFHRWVERIHTSKADGIVARTFYYTCGTLIGWRMNVEGHEHLTKLLTARDGKPQSAVVIGNHQR